MYAANALVASYYAANETLGHRYNCALGAGADCTCPEGEVTYYVVTVVLQDVQGPRSYVLHFGRNKGQALDRAQSARRGHWSGVRLRKVTLHQSDDGYSDFIERCEQDVERIEDWMTD